jgi:signal transduction histidine kinase
MSSLRTRIAILIACSIVAVVMLATLAAVTVIGRPGPERAIHPAARQLDLLLRTVEERPQLFTNGASHIVEIVPNPAKGHVMRRLTDDLTTAMDRLGRPREIVATMSKPGDRPTISARVGPQGWVVIPLMEPPPPSGSWIVLVSWMALIVLGATVVALVVAARTVAPLALLDRMVAEVGPDGRLPRLPEDGPAEIRSTARALNRLSARLQSAIESRMRLVAAAGHDLRTPMTRMRLRAEFLPDEERVHWLRDLDELDRIADSAIRLVREEAGQSSAERVRLDRMVEEIAAELADQGRNVQVDDLAPCLCETAPQALTRALRNLIINAATHGGGAVVGVACAGAKAEVVIEDRGPGIPEALMERVFEPFFRVDPARRQAVAGAGLGLAIAKEIIDRLGGSLALENRPEGGLRQRVTLPALPTTGRE